MMVVFNVKIGEVTNNVNVICDVALSFRALLL